jgi:uncharacterized protein YcfJ
MSRKLWIPALALGLAAVSTGALADHDRGGYPYGDEDRYADYDYARVVGVEPLRRRIRVSEPVRECWDEVEYGPDRRAVRGTAGGTLLGALIGGVIGNQVGDHDSRRVARAAGAIIGGAVGNSVSKQRMRGRDDDREYVYERCDVRYRERYEERIDGYEVTYEYAGRRYVTEMPYDPGDRIRIRVDVTPTGG